MSTLPLELQRRVVAALEGHGLLPRRAAVGIAISGGRDSVCLASLLGELQAWGGWRLQAIHFDHQLRGPEAGAAETACCEALCRQLQIPLHTELLQIRGQPGESLEEAARNARLAALRRFAIRARLSHIATAHQADDRVETLLFRLLRGTGVRGLPGIGWRREERVDGVTVSTGPSGTTETATGIRGRAGTVLTYHRPLLGVWRHETTEYCRAKGLAWVDDASNESEAHTRNRIRRSLVPKLEEFNAAAQQHLWELAQDAEEWLAGEPQEPAPTVTLSPEELAYGLDPAETAAAAVETGNSAGEAVEAGAAAGGRSDDGLPAAFPFQELPWVLDGATLVALGRVRAIAALQQILEAARRRLGVRGAPGRRNYDLLWNMLQDPAGPAACDLPGGFRVRRQGTPPHARLVIERPAPA